MSVERGLLIRTFRVQCSVIQCSEPYARIPANSSSVVNASDVGRDATTSHAVVSWQDGVQGSNLAARPAPSPCRNGLRVRRKVDVLTHVKAAELFHPTSARYDDSRDVTAAGCIRVWLACREKGDRVVYGEDGGQV